MKKLFSKCILINKWYYKTIVLIIGPRMRTPAAARPRPRPGNAPAGPPAAAHARPVRPQPPARDCSVGPPVAFQSVSFRSIIKLQCLLLIHLLNNKFETYNCFISYHHYHYLLHLLLCHALLVHKPQC